MIVILKKQEGLNLEKYGRHTENSNEIINGRIYFPFDELKGYGLEVKLEVLYGILTAISMFKPLNLG